MKRVKAICTLLALVAWGVVCGATGTSARQVDRSENCLDNNGCHGLTHEWGIEEKIPGLVIRPLRSQGGWRYQFMLWRISEITEIDHSVGQFLTLEWEGERFRVTKNRWHFPKGDGKSAAPDLLREAAASDKVTEPEIRYVLDRLEPK